MIRSSADSFNITAQCSAFCSVLLMCLIVVIYGPVGCSARSEEEEKVLFVYSFYRFHSLSGGV